MTEDLGNYFSVYVSSDDCLIGVLKWAVANQATVREKPDTVKELLDLINLEEISYKLITQISAWVYLETALDKTNLLKEIFNCKRYQCQIYTLSDQRE